MSITLLDTRSLTDEVREALRLRAVAAREAGFRSAAGGGRPPVIAFTQQQNVEPPLAWSDHRHQ